ncbi:hypothetical protein Tcan_11545 [Toxocara canis]|uniref:Uncharacterized protein n=1 Tax=Toxocara canis TaxID=6265 RepID=A0A0B2UWZ1_TOXCA|nr:hypothetical protein Tcan_11545 [Toxocara canis]
MLAIHYVPQHVDHLKKQLKHWAEGDSCRPVDVQSCLMEIFNGYNAQVPPADPELRQYNIGFWFQPDGASKWDDGTAYNTDVWPGFPESMPELTGYSCVNFDPETGKPVIGDCALLYDVVACEQRCVSLSYLKGCFVKCCLTIGWPLFAIICVIGTSDFFNHSAARKGGGCYKKASGSARQCE